MWRLAVTVALALPGSAVAAFTCEADGTATQCPLDGGACFSRGPCPLGCDEASAVCGVPSNVPLAALVADGGTLTFLPSATPATLSTDTGEIVDGTGAVLRAAGEGLDPGSRITFTRVAQVGAPPLGVFSVDALALRAGVTVHAVGAAALAVVAASDISIEGTLDVGARGSFAGPGGFDGGVASLAGEGPCGGPAAPLGTDACPELCTAGAGGAGHGGPGGAGGDVDLPAYSTMYPMTAGAGTCGSTGLHPLVGGSGGASGAQPGSYTSATPGEAPVPGHGGGGGGAVQLVALGSISITGAVTAPGEGGGPAVSAGGASGGAGGAILLEAPLVTLAATGALAANGGGGGAGDCL